MAWRFVDTIQWLWVSETGFYPGSDSQRLKGFCRGEQEPFPFAPTESFLQPYGPWTTVVGNLGDAHTPDVPLFVGLSSRFIQVSKRPESNTNRQTGGFL